jgi:hypothetical protein
VFTKHFLSHKKAVTIGGVVLAVVLAIFPMIYRAWALGSDAWRLTIIALLDHEEMPWSPFDSDSLAIRPAETNPSYPYSTRV